LFPGSCAETGLAHIACAVGTPNVILLGGGHFGRFMPYSGLRPLLHFHLIAFGCDWKCKYKNPYCVNQINHSLLTQAIKDAVNNPAGKPKVYIQKDWKGKNPESDIFVLDKFLSPCSVAKIFQEMKSDDHLGNTDLAEKHTNGKNYEAANDNIDLSREVGKESTSVKNLISDKDFLSVKSYLVNKFKIEKSRTIPMA